MLVEASLSASVKQWPWVRWPSLHLCYDKQVISCSVSQCVAGKEAGECNRTSLASRCHVRCLWKIYETKTIASFATESIFIVVHSVSKFIIIICTSSNMFNLCFCTDGVIRSSVHCLWYIFFWLVMFYCLFLMACSLIAASYFKSIWQLFNATCYMHAHQNQLLLPLVFLHCWLEIGKSIPSENNKVSK